MIKLYHELERLIKEIRPDWPICLSGFIGKTMGELMWYLYGQNDGRDWSVFLMSALRDDLISEYFGVGSREIEIKDIPQSSAIVIYSNGVAIMAIDYIKGAGDRHPK